RLAGESKVSGTLSGTLRASVRILFTLARLHVPRGRPLRVRIGAIAALLAGSMLAWVWMRRGA
ncbi:MAG TPA: hypothetical protein VH916_01015, partial [Dehalococcoidia bacterium]